MIEAELKARVADREALRAQLAAVAGEPEWAVYQDVYFDRHEELARDGRELRVRHINLADTERTILSYKGPVVDAATGSKPEFETEVAEFGGMIDILEGLGYKHTIEFSKDCEIYRLSTPAGRSVLATLVSVIELLGVFLEVETMVENEDEVPAALDDLRALLLDLDLGPDTLTTELYTDAVARARERDRSAMDIEDFIWGGE